MRMFIERVDVTGIGECISVSSPLACSNMASLFFHPLHMVRDIEAAVMYIIQQKEQ
jgi:hypothetical protein